MSSLHEKTVAGVLLSCFACASSALATQEPQLTEEQMGTFLLNAKVINARIVSKGITGIQRLTMCDGQITHDAAFQSIDEHIPLKRFDDGRTEINYSDSYKYNIAAYELAKLLGLGDMMPVTVERKWAGRTGSLSWWLPYKLDEETRQQKKIKVPDLESWAKQMNKMNVFEQLVCDTDRNMQNSLYSDDWHLWMIDFSKAFHTVAELKPSPKPTQCERRLFAALKQLDAAELTAKTKGYLTKAEIKGVMARRDEIVALFEKLIAEKGEAQVLYDF